MNEASIRIYWSQKWAVTETMPAKNHVRSQEHVFKLTIMVDCDSTLDYYLDSERSGVIVDSFREIE